MSIDMQFSFLSNDLASAKQAEGKVRGTDGGCGDKGFGDVFEEQLQQAAESDAEQKAKNLLTGQEVAAMLNNTLPDTASADTIDIAGMTGSDDTDESAGFSADAEGTAAEQLIKQELSTNKTDTTLKLSDGMVPDTNQQKLSAAQNSNLTASETNSLFHLIAKARDYAAELETATQPAETTTSAVTALSALAGLKSQGITEDHGAPLIADPEASELSALLLKSAQADDSTEPADSASEQAATTAFNKTQAAINQQMLAETEQATTADSSAVTEAQQTQVAADGATGKLTPEEKAIGPQTESLRQLLQQTKPEAEATSAAEPQAGASQQRPLATEQKPAVVAVTEQALAEKNQAVTSSAQTPDALQNTNNLNAAVQTEATPAVTEQAGLSAALPSPTLNTAASGKNNKTATVGFAEFQKAANAALAQQQKQQTEAQQQSGQQSAVQSESSGPELMVVQPGVVPHEQPQLASSLAATEKALGGAGFSQSGSQSGGQSHHQSQQGFSQILAARQLDSQTQNQPSLSLLEPTAANQLKERVMFQVNQKIQSAEIRLAPEELGSVQIKINLQQEQLSVQFVVQQSAAKEALEQQMPRLKELLQEQGMALTDGQVHQQQQEQQSQQDDRRTASGRAGAGTIAEDEAEVAAQQVQIAVSDRMVDYYA